MSVSLIRPKNLNRAIVYTNFVNEHFILKCGHLFSLFGQSFSS